MTLSTNKPAWIEARIAQETCSVGFAYVLLLLVGGLGAHNFYLGRPRLAVAQLVCFACGSWLQLLWGVAAGGRPDSFRTLRSEILAIVGLIALVAVGVTLLIDLVTIPFLVERQKADVRQRVMSQLEPSS